MEETIISPRLGNRVYTMSSMSIAVLIGGPLVVGYLMASNFKQLGEPKKARRAWFWSLVGFIALLAVSAFLPVSIPNIVYNLLFYGIAAFFIHKYQGSLITAHMQAGGLTYKTSRAVLV